MDDPREIAAVLAAVKTPNESGVRAAYRELDEAFDRSATPEERTTAVGRWDQLRRELETWEALVNLRFHQDTRNDAFKQAREYCDELRPKLTELAVHFKRKLLGCPQRAELEQAFGAHAFRLWSADVLTYEPAIEADMVTEARLEAEYVGLQAGARLEFQGQTYNHSEMLRFREHADRATRHGAEQVRWGWYAANREKLDRIYGDLVHLRHRMARQLNFRDFIELGYQRMKRVDYNQHDVERFRAEVREQLVPLALELRRRQAGRLGVQPLMFWDEALHDPRGNPAPRGDAQWQLAQAREMYDALGEEFGAFFRLMVDAELLDLDARDGKAGGGFCTSFPQAGVPFIFANFNGTKGDVEVLTHEMGHAFQGYLSRHQPLADYLWPTYESCEIHSMGLEFLTWPYMEKFFGEDADRFRQIHLEQSLLFIPYGVAVDHFQHLVYAEPDATPERRHAMWREMEEMYLPWRQYGDLPHVVDGGFWQFQRHIYLAPFYYIDYTLAQTCALQLWAQARRDRDATLRNYVALCRRGGEAPFQELARSAGLISPFQPGCLAQVVAEARRDLLGE